ncbi:MAG: NUDIX hydrolase [Clostridia bacterium]|nr:NUDIX hydrolase [Clostridia bacterium]
MNISEKIDKSTVVYKGKFINVEKVEVTLPNGHSACRDIIRHPGACAVVAMNDHDEIIMIRQYRTAFDKVFIEIPAGKIDPGEDPLICAKRELKEETGYVSDDFCFLSKIALAPGYSDELIHLYLARNIRYEGISLDDDEFLSIEKISLKKAVQMVMNGDIENSIAMIAVMLVSSME